MNDTTRYSKSGVTLALPMIRPMVQQLGCDLRGYSDDEIADALLHTYPHPAAQWLSPEHLTSAYEQLIRTASIGGIAYTGRAGDGGQ